MGYNQRELRYLNDLAVESRTRVALAEQKEGSDPEVGFSEDTRGSQHAIREFGRFLSLPLTNIKDE